MNNNMRIGIVIGLLLAGLVLLSACGGGSAALEDGTAAAGEDEAAAEPSIAVDIEIGERMFAEQVNDIYLNPDDYIGKTIKYEGIYEVFDSEDEMYRYVIRYGPGCCGDDGVIGFGVDWKEDTPKNNDWVEVIGTLERVTAPTGLETLQLAPLSMTVLEERGTEFVDGQGG
ncbi:MAG: hypothetical protein FWH32_01355 [Clostridiales bacterium]|nr:hypothetical protein [Clostridiales bacterium]